MKKNIIAIISWALVLWACKVFLSSLPYKFGGHPDTVHIFSTIGNWLSGIAGSGIGEFFSSNGAVIVGSFELITSIILLSPAIFWVLSKLNIVQSSYRKVIHQYGGLLASAVMGGAMFFHLVTPLGITVLHEGKSDGGSLFYAATSIFFSGIILFIINRK
jgi:hypothetical protein